MTCPRDMLVRAEQDSTGCATRSPRTHRRGLRSPHLPLGSTHPGRQRRCLGLRRTLRCTLWEGEGAPLLVRSAEGRGFKVMVSPPAAGTQEGGDEELLVHKPTLRATFLPDTTTWAPVRHTHCKTKVHLDKQRKQAAMQTLTNSQRHTNLPTKTPLSEKDTDTYTHTHTRHGGVARKRSIQTQRHPPIPPEQAKIKKGV